MWDALHAYLNIQSHPRQSASPVFGIKPALKEKPPYTNAIAIDGSQNTWKLVASIYNDTEISESGSRLSQHHPHSRVGHSQRWRHSQMGSLPYQLPRTASQPDPRPGPVYQYLNIDNCFKIVRSREPGRPRSRHFLEPFFRYIGVPGAEDNALVVF